MPAEQLLQLLGSSPSGLSSDVAAARLAEVGPNLLAKPARSGAFYILLRQFGNPIVLMLLLAASLALGMGASTDASVILAIVLASGLLGFWQEYGAAGAMRELLATVAVEAVVLRDGQEVKLPVEKLVPGDVVKLAAGSSVPADCLLLGEKDLFVNEAALTGESFPVDKSPGIVPDVAALAQRSNVLFMGTHVVSGEGTALVVRTGRATEFGTIAQRLRLRQAETEFERGVRRLGYLLLELTLILVVLIFAANVFLQRPVLDSFLFALALAVGLTPQLLPAVVSVNLARGARLMARSRVIVKRLVSIENFGSMDVLCCDKTGTLTEGRMRLHSALRPDGSSDRQVLFWAALNARFQSAFRNPIDDALRAVSVELDGWSKLDEVPYDFLRRRLGVLARAPDGKRWLVVKGAVPAVLDVCNAVEVGPGDLRSLTEERAGVEALYAQLGSAGYRCIAVAYRAAPDETALTRQSEADLVLLGLVAFEDPLKEGIATTVATLRKLGVRLKLISGDSALLAAKVASEAGLTSSNVVTGSQLRASSDSALLVLARDVDVFAEVEPGQKERLVGALRKAGHVVGFLGDGINDAPALHAADVGISVSGAVDVARQAADIVLLESDLGVLAAGVQEGRRTFANTLKYVFMATSANFGNMFSMAGASLLLPFLPLLPKQVLLTNFLTDIPELSIASDRVDADWIERPRRWDIAFIRRFMLVFGLVSSIFDYLTFAVLLWVLHAGPAEFRTGWFVESVVSAVLVVLVIRTARRAWQSRPAAPLAAAIAAVVLLTVLLPYTPLAGAFSLTPLPSFFLAILAALVLLYAATAEVAKVWFYSRLSQRSA
jgi:Mg2+-importing ATPase